MTDSLHLDTRPAADTFADADVSNFNSTSAVEGFAPEILADEAVPSDNVIADDLINDNVAADASAADANVEAAEAIDAAPAVPAGPNGFELLGLAPELVAAVADLGYTEPTTVQKATIPLAMQPGDAVVPFNDLMVSSQTGSGKTAAFLLPVLHALLQQQQAAVQAEADEWAKAVADAAERGEPAPKRNKRKDPTNPRNFKATAPGALILCPTRELAQQVAHDAIGLVTHCKGLRVANVVGGMPYALQIAKLQNANLVVATPGRLLDLQRSSQIKLDQVQFLVVDEADRMLDLGFSDDLADINQMTSQRRQTMMFSATFASRIQQLAMRVMHDNGSAVKKIQIDSPQEKHANIRQVMFWADNAQHKRKLLDHWLRDTTIDQAIVFCSTQIECDGLANELQQDNFSAVALHGALSQGMRNRRLMALRNGQVQILVATDVAARGLDVPTITHVFNYGLPMKAEDYTHRIGRTGRAGRSGLAVTFAEFRDRRRMSEIESYTHQSLKAEVVPGLEPQQRFPALRPSNEGAGRGGPRKGGFGGGGGGGFGGGNRGGFNAGGNGGGGFGGGGRGREEGNGYANKSGFNDRNREQPRFAPAQDNGGFGGGGGQPRGEFRGRPDGEFRGRPGGEFRGRPEGEFRGRPDGGESRGRPEGFQADRPAFGKPFGGGDRAGAGKPFAPRDSKPKAFVPRPDANAARKPRV